MIHSMMTLDVLLRINLRISAVWMMGCLQWIFLMLKFEGTAMGKVEQWNSRF